jgi:hypothetical protein
VGARHRAGGRPGKPAANQNLVDYNFSVDWSETTADGPGRIEIGRRARGSPSTSWSPS